MDPASLAYARRPFRRPVPGEISAAGGGLGSTASCAMAAVGNSAAHKN